MDFLADTSYKQSQAEVIGSLTASAVATGSQLVGYSGFSNEAFVREPYSPDLDFGAGEWSVSAWVNIPVSLPLPTETTNLITNGVNFIDSNADGTPDGWARTNALLSIVNNNLRIQNFSSRCTAPAFATTSGKLYGVTVTTTASDSNIRLEFPDGSNTGYFTAPGTSTFYFTAISGSSVVGIYTGFATDVYLQEIKCFEVKPFQVTNRSFSSGSSLEVGVYHQGKLTAIVSDNSTFRIITTTTAYNTGTWLKVDTYYKTDGSLSIAVNGQQVATTGSQTPLLTLNNSNAVLTIGNNYSLTAPFPGSIALLKLSATVPTTEQLQWMYEQEKALFNPNTLCALPDSSSILDIAYEDDTNRLIAISQSNESYWTGLTRVVTEPVTTGGLLSKVAATSNVHLVARSTVDAGVDVTIPASNIKTMLERDRASETIQQITIFDYDPAVFSSASLSSTTPSIMTCAAANVANTPYVGMTITGTGITAGTTIVGIVTGTSNTYYLSSPFTGTTGTYTVSQTSFQLPIGYTTTAVYKNGTELRESISATKDWTRSFDGFKEVIILTTAPASTEWIQIHATKDN